jgi:hypothetical protein
MTGMGRNHVCALALGAAVVWGGPASSAQEPGLSDAARAAHCAVSDDPAYGVTPAHPVQVGGGAMFVASREKRYMDALRGPAGEPVRYRRLNTAPSPHGPVTLDVYEATYDSADGPVTLYLDAFHFDDRMRAPKGFTCGAPLDLAPPGPDLFQASRLLARLAVEQGASREFAPIPLDADAGGGPARGIALDHFRMMAAVARSAAQAGQPAANLSDSLRQRTVVVAYPFACGDRTIEPKTIDMATAQGQTAPRQGEDAKGEGLAALLPGLQLPAGSLAATFGLQAPRPGDIVRIVYAEACGGVSDVILPLRHTPVRAVRTSDPPLPDGITSPGSVRLQAQVDLGGALRHLTYVGGPRALVDAAMQAVRAWTVEPARINNAPISTPVMLQVKFVAAPAGERP